jgi:hypothetical protein
MAEVTLASASEKQKWISDYFAEYVRESGFKGYMGRSNNSIIIAKYELQEEAGKTINIPLITRLKSRPALPVRRFSTATKKSWATTTARSRSIGAATASAFRSQPASGPKSTSSMPPATCSRCGKPRRSATTSFARCCR